MSKVQSQESYDSVEARLSPFERINHDVLLYREFSADQLQRLKWWDKFFDISLAFGAPGSTLSGLAIWTYYPQGKVVWAVFSFLVALLAVLKERLQLSEKMEMYRNSYKKFSDLSFDLDTHIQVNDEPTIERITRLRERLKTIAHQDEPAREKLLEPYRTAANRHIQDFRYTMRQTKPTIAETADT